MHGAGREILIVNKSHWFFKTAFWVCYFLCTHDRFYWIEVEIVSINVKLLKQDNFETCHRIRQIMPITCFLEDENSKNIL